MSWTQVWDTPAIRLEKVHYLLPKRKYSCCRKITTSMVPFGQAGTVTYGPNVNAAAILLGSAGEWHCSNYTSIQFANTLRSLRIRQSVGRTVSDNAMAESFFGTLKNERVHRVVYPTPKGRHRRHCRLY
jgi:hypothetical protein